MKKETVVHDCRICRWYDLKNGVCRQHLESSNCEAFEKRYSWW